MESLIRVSRGVWRPAEAIADEVGRAAALLSCLPPESALADLTAGRLHDLWLPPSTPRRVDVVLRTDMGEPRRFAGSRRSEVRARRRTVADDEVTMLQGLPVTTLERTWLDLAEILNLADLVAAGDSALRAGATRTGMQTVVNRAVRRRGVVRARKALTLLDPRSRSRPETHLRVGLVEAGLPAPDVNVPIYSADGEWLAEPDLSYRDARLAIEYNGLHHAGLDRMRRDITRDVDVALRGGWRSLVFGPSEVFKHVDQCVLLIGRTRRHRLRQAA